MMAARPFKSLFRGAGRNALDLPVAGLAALAAAFAAFAMPQDLLSRAVVATGLPSLLSAAQPPLGVTARVVLAVGGAAIAFGLVFLLLRLLDRSGMNDAAEAKAQDDLLSPRLRRRDVHPDAPALRPISAARDFGEPVPPEAPRAVSFSLDGAELVAIEPPPEPQPESATEAEPEIAAEPEAHFWREAPPEAVTTPWQEPEPDPEFMPEPVAERLPEPEPVFVPEPEAPAEPVAGLLSEPAPFIEPEPVVEPEPALEQVPAIEDERAAEPELLPESEFVAQAPAEAAPPSVMPTSIAALMERLEQGLAKRRMIEPGPTRPAAPPQVFPEAPDDRLQSAIASLQRLASRSS
jgi:hypothetical protein